MGEADSAQAATSPSYARGVNTPHFRRLWWVWTVTLLGDGVRTFALPLFVAVETGDPLAVSAVAFAGVLPWLLTALPAGAIVDRMRPKPVLVSAHLLRVVLIAVLIGAITTEQDRLPTLCAFAFLMTLTETFAYPASQVLMVELAGRDQLNEANSKFYAVHTVGMLLAGPLAGGALLAFQEWLAFGLVGLAFLVAPVLVVGLPGVEPKAAKGKVRVGELASEVGEGVRLLAGVSGLRVLVGLISAATIAIGAVNTLIPLYAVDTLDMPTWLVSSLLIIGALGILSASRLVVPVARKWTDGAVLVTSMGVFAFGMVLFGALPFVAAALLANLVLGLGLGGFNVLAAARRQRLTPPEAMGRVSGAYRMLSWGLMPIGAGLAGPLADATSLGTVFVVAGCLVLVALVALTRPLLRAEVPAPEPPADQDAAAQPTTSTEATNPATS